MRVVGIAGSLRSGSYSRRVLEEATQLAPDIDWTIIRLQDIPPYDADLEARGLPPSVQQLKDQIAAADALLIVTPEYNHGIPGVLKNAIDWASRPAFRSPLAGTRVALVGISPSRHGARLALEQLRQVLESTRAEIVEPVISLPEIHERLSDRRLDERTRNDVRRLLDALRHERAAAAVS